MRLIALFLITAAAFGQSYRTGSETAKPGVPVLTLEDTAGGLIAGIAAEKGAELCTLRFRVKGKWVELLYKASDYTPAEGFAGKAPLLWPATGRSFTQRMLAEMEQSGQGRDDGGWVWQGREYPMPIHGFAKDLPWKLERQYTSEEGAFAVFSLEDSGQTRQWYPFGFRLTATFRAAGGALDIVYAVRASQRNQSEMPFSIGNHIAFRAPLVGTDPGAVRIETPATVEVPKNRFSVPTGETRPWSTPATIGELPPRTAISLTGYPTPEPYILLRDPGGLAIRMSHRYSSLPAQPVLLFNLWGDPAAGFFSPEPWVGLQNSLNLNQGLVRLKPGGSFRWAIRIEPSASGS